MIVITGATGTIGRELTAQLAAGQIPFRAVFRPSDQSRGKGIPGESLHPADLQEQSARTKALEGVTKLFLCTPLTDHQLSLQNQIFETSLSLGVRHVVKLGTMATDKDSRISHARWHRDLEERIKQSGIGWTFLQPTLFSTVIFEPWAWSSDQQDLALPLRNGRIPLVDPRDVAAVAFRALTDSAKKRGQTYTITGPEALSMAQVAIMISSHLRETVRYHDISQEAFVSHAQKQGLPSWLCQDLAEMFEYFAFNRGSQLSLLPAKILEKPRTFREFISHSATPRGSVQRTRNAS